MAAYGRDKILHGCVADMAKEWWVVYTGVLHMITQSNWCLMGE